MISNSPQLLLRLRLTLLSLVHAAADAEERLSREARRLRWAVRDRIDEASALVPAASLLLRGSVRMLSTCVQALTVLLSLLPTPSKLQRRWRAAVAAQKLAPPSSSSTPTPTSSSLSALPSKKRQPRGRPPPRPATEAAVILAEADEAELPLDRVANVVEWCSQSGLERLFVFDPAGHVKRRASELSEELFRRKRRGGGGAEATLQQSWAGPLFFVTSSSSSSSAPPSTSSSAPPPSSSNRSPSLHVHLLSGEDAEAPLLAVAAAVAAARKEEEESKKVAAGDGAAKTDAAASPPAPEEEEEGDVVPPSCSSSSSSARELDAALSATRFGGACAARPQVCLCYGGGGGGRGSSSSSGGGGGSGGSGGALFTLAGFPAWGLAQAEVYSMGPLREATRRGVREAAERFVSTSQRFGR